MKEIEMESIETLRVLRRHRTEQQHLELRAQLEDEFDKVEAGSTGYQVTAECGGRGHHKVRVNKNLSNPTGT